MDSMELVVSAHTSDEIGGDDRRRDVRAISDIGAISDFGAISDVVYVIMKDRFGGGRWVTSGVS